jgi:hypothetical protein
MNADSSGFDTRETKAKQRQVLLILLGCFVFGALFLAQLVRFMTGGELALSEGDVAPRDIRATQRAQFVSDVETKRQRDLAEASIAPIFSAPDTQVSRQQMVAARNLLDQITAIRIITSTERTEQIGRLMALPTLGLSESDANRILDFSNRDWASVNSETLAVLDNELRSSIRPDNVESVKKEIERKVSFNLGQNEADIVKRLVGVMLVPNTNFDEGLTQVARKQARESVKSVERSYEADQIVVRSGQIISAADVEALDKLNLRRPTLTLGDLSSAALFALIYTGILAIASIRSDMDAQPIRHHVLSAAAIVVSAILAQWLLPSRGLLTYLIPIATVSIVVSAWSRTMLGVASAIVISGLLGSTMDKPLEMTSQYAVGGLVASLTLGRAERLSSFIRAGALAGVAQALLVLAFNFPTLQRADVPQLVTNALSAFSSGLLAAGLASALLYLSSLLLDITTVVQLIDLARPSHPLLQKLLMEAPGTYHHSLMVGNLAEHAAERIHADSLLTRVGAYYHDIGKLFNPQYFIENQLDGVNLHDQLDPRTSSSILQNHVTEGERLAKQHRLPSRVRAFIAEHHGTTRTNFQYQQACKEADRVIDDSSFRYPGPRPQSKETALLMLADASEATVRACKCSTIEEMEGVISRVFRDRLEDHQLDESHLTLRELESTRQSFLDTLRGMYHPRVTYPDQITQITQPKEANPVHANEAAVAGLNG